MSKTKPPSSGPSNKVINMVLALGAIAGCIGIGWFIFGPIGLFLGGGAGVGALVLYLLIWANSNLRNKPFLDLEHATFMDIVEDTMMANLPTPVPLKVAKTPYSTITSHPGDIFGRTKLPVEPEFYNLTGEVHANLAAEQNTVWAYRMRMAHKRWNPLNKKDQYIAIVCQSQIHPDSLDATGDIQFNTPVLATGHWAKYGVFYILYNTSKELALATAAIDTVKSTVALRESQNRMAESAESNSRTNADIIAKREAGKNIVDVIKG